MMPPWLKPATTVCAGVTPCARCSSAIKAISARRLCSACSGTMRGPCAVKATWNQANC
jgi:tRNA(Arg) A34 adenosine deaminase TadA